MAAYNIGDRVICKVNGRYITNSCSTSYDKTVILEIIDNNFENGYLIYVPPDLPLSDAIYIDSYNFEWYELDKRFLEAEVLHIADHHIVRLHDKCDGLKCLVCHAFVPMAEANVNNKFFCWSCRTYRGLLVNKLK